MTSTVSKVILVSLAALSLAACSNTLQGIGQDIEKAGEKIQSSTK